MTLADKISLADLVAQMSMADSAKSMILLTGVQIIIGFLGTVVLIYNIYQAGISQRQANKGIDQADKNYQLSNQALDLQREMAEIQLRAYLTFDIKNAEYKHDRLNIIVNVQNKGTTPAILKVIEFTQIIEKNTDKIGIVGANINQNVESVIPANDTMMIIVPIIYSDGNDYTYRITTNGDCQIYLYGKITYTDVFRKVHHTVYSAELSADDGILNTKNFRGFNGFWEGDNR